MSYNAYQDDIERFIELVQEVGVDVTVMRSNADYFVVELEGNFYDYRDIEWAVMDSGGRTIHFRLFEDGYAELTIGF